MLTKGDIDWLEDSFLPKLAEKVKNEIKEPLDAINTKLDLLERYKNLEKNRNYTQTTMTVWIHASHASKNTQISFLLLASVLY